jgi:hypothetical protein
VAALVSLCALTGCSNSSDVARSPSTTSSTLARTTTSTSSAPPTSSASTAVLASYRASWSAFEHALADANPSNPGLVATMVDPQLEGVKATCWPTSAKESSSGAPSRCTKDRRAEDHDGNGGRLRLQHLRAGLCQYRQACPSYHATENDGVESSLALTCSTWKVAKQNVTDGTCAPGS